MTTKRQKIDSIIRVNYAGEYAANIIYSAQENFTKDDAAKKEISEMKEQELEHLNYFEEQLKSRNVRPSFLMPVWHAASFALGAITAIAGKETAMACTIAVEEAITEHYQEQLDSLDDSEIDLKEKIQKFKEDEEHHKNTAIENDGMSAPCYNIVKHIIKFGSKAAIEIAKKI
jgi:ubiquinone biosynthesis monooxygenase Coq7